MTREEALQIIWDRCQHSKETEKALEVLKKERPHGEWIFKNGKYRCSVCLEPCATFCMNEPRDRFCLWCGSEIEKKRDGMNVSQVFADEWIGEKESE